MSNDTTITTTVNGVFAPDDEYVTKRKTKSKANFTAVGRFRDKNLRHYMKSMDIVDAVISMSKPTQRFFQLLKCNRDNNTNMCDIRGNDMTQPVISRAYNELKKGDAVRRVRKDLYMINPGLILVYPENREYVEEMWKTL